MGQIFELIQTLLNPDALLALLQSYGWVAYLILIAIVFAETGLLVGFCLPGDSLLFVAGFMCSDAAQNALNVWLLIPVLIVAAIVGDSVGYWLGLKTGPRIFSREDSLLFHRKHLIRTQRFYEKYGGRTIVYARFVPIVRTFAPFVAGVGKMEYRRFVSYNVFGGIGWVTSMVLLGYFLGAIPVVKNNLEKAVILVIVLSVMPMVIEFIRSRGREDEDLESAPLADGSPAISPVKEPAE